MRRFLLLAAVVVAMTASSANAQVITYGNVTNFSGNVFANGGTASVGGILTTRSVMDQIQLGQLGGVPTTIITFSVSNANPTPVSARPRLRFYDDDGPAGAPGTLLAAFSFNAITFPANGLQLFNGNVGGGFVSPADGRFWASMFFDGSGTPATAAELDNLGQLLFNPPTYGSSDDNFFSTTTAGVFGSNPPGTITNFGGTPVANFGWQFQAVPEPGSMALMGIAAVGGLLRLRRKKA